MAHPELTNPRSTGSQSAEDGLRRLGAAGTTGLIAGVIGGGIGGRIVMRISAIAADSDGLLTEGGNRVGDVTVGGSIAVMIFAGAVPGVFGGFVLFATRPWLPRSLWLRAAAFALAFPAMIGAVVIAAENKDFLILDPPELNIAMFAALFVLFGGAVVLIEAILLPLLTPATTGAKGDPSPYLALLFLAPVAFVALLLLADRLVTPAFFLFWMGVATSLRLTAPTVGPNAHRPRRAVTTLGYSSLAGGIATGVWSLAREIESIV